uniref:AfsR/SARP family transcriptional regulator n=1 Tax=Amycolatopsis sp. CA-096443 TaxID=3239919 RepID=UPI003F492B75
MAVAPRNSPDVVTLPEGRLSAATRAEFAHVLRRVMTASGLGPAKTARASGIPRSQIYYLIDAERDSLPRKEEQLRAFLHACRLAPYQVEFVLTQWRALSLHRKAFGGQQIPPALAESAQGVRIRLLGPVRLLADGIDLPIGYAGIRALLALLALRANKVVGLDEIVDALWGDDPPRSARSIVHGNVSHLRRSLRGIRDAASTIGLATTAAGYTLSAEAEQIDVEQARRLRDQAAAGGAETASALLTRALELWTGPPLDGVPRLAGHVAELEELRRDIHSTRVEADLQLGRNSEVIGELSPIVRADPYSEPAAGQLMRALYQAGRRADALDVYATTTRSLAESLGIEPGPELRELHRQLLNDELPAGIAAPSRRHPIPAQLPSPVPVLVGRDADLAWLDSLAEQSDAGATATATAIAIVTGAGGVGKTALAVWWAHRRAGRFPDGVLFASLHGFSAGRSPLEPADVLAQFLLGLGIPSGQIPELLDERVALYRSLIAGRRTLVVLDDVRDPEQIRPLLPPGPRTLTIVTGRSWLAGIAVANAAEHRVVGTLAPDDAIRLIEHRAGSVDAEHGAQLAALCDYLPLALVLACNLAASPQALRELVAKLRIDRSRLATLEVDDSGLSVRRTIDPSFRNLPDDLARTFLLLGAIPVRTVNPYLFALVADIPVAAARRHLQRLTKYSLVAETAPDVFESHDLVRLYLHERAAAELHATQLREITGKALRYYQTAADRARRAMLRVVDPVDFTELLADAEVPAFADFAQAHEWFVRERPNLLAILDSAFRAGLYQGVWRLARIAHAYRVVSPLAEEWSRMIDLGMRAATAAGNVSGQCWMLLSRCSIALILGQPQDCLADAERAEQLARDLGDTRLHTVAKIHLGTALSRLAEHDHAITRLREAIEKTDRDNDPVLYCQALNDCAEAEKDAGRFLDAIAHQLQSLSIDRKLGHDSFAVVSLHNLAELHLRIDAPGTAERYARGAVGLAVRREFTVQESIARVTLARVLRTQKRLDDAREQLTLSLRVCAHPDPNFAAGVRAELAELESGAPAAEAVA